MGVPVEALLPAALAAGCRMLALDPGSSDFLPDVIRWAGSVGIIVWADTVGSFF